MNKSFASLIVVLASIVVAIVLSFILPWTYAAASFFYIVGAWTMFIGFTFIKERKSYELISSASHNVLIGGVLICIAATLTVSAITSDLRLQVISFLVVLIIVLILTYVVNSLPKNKKI